MRNILHAKQFFRISCFPVNKLNLRVYEFLSPLTEGCRSKKEKIRDLYEFHLKFGDAHTNDLIIILPEHGSQPTNPK
jgi:hypothetical protein